jgi:hypothetical protein
MTTRVILAALLIAAPIAAQAPEEQRTPWLVSVASWGKFATLGLAGGFLALAAGSHASAEDSYDALLSRCQTDSSLCILGVNGAYLDPGSESLYQESLDGDAVARQWLLVSQVALGASALLWIIDLTQGSDDPENIPYVPLRVVVGPRETRVGVQFSF